MVNISWVKLHLPGELYGLTALENKEDGISMQVKRELDYWPWEYKTVRDTLGGFLQIGLESPTLA